MKMKLEVVQQENQQLRKKLDELKGFENLQKDTAKQLAEKELNLDQLRRCFNEVVAEKDELIEQKNAEYKALEAKVDKLPTENASLKKQMADLHKKNDHLSRKCSELETLREQIEEFH
uniref:Uncharacterized protein n=1 Tax=Ditylenchus dipsaci TaxID=166011 RepID=A0A915EAP9_9BILA